jgi:signal transduction histidine kinase/CheY-like chemotaxis protein
MAYQCDLAEQLRPDPWAQTEGWQAVEAGSVHLPSRSHACWVRVEVLPSHDGQSLSFLDLHVARVDIDLLDAQGQALGRAVRLGTSTHAWVTGRQATFSGGWPAPTRLYARLTPVAGTQDIPGTASAVRMAWVQAEVQLRHEQQVDHINTAAVWALLTCTLVAVFYQFALRSPDFGIFAAYAAFQALTHFAKSGLGFVFDDGVWCWLNPALWQYVVSALSAWFYVRYGRFRLHSPLLARAGQTVAMGFAALVLFQLVRPAWADSLIFVLLPLHFGVAVWGNVRGWRRGERTCIILLVGLAPIAAYWGIFALHGVGWGQAIPTDWAMGSTFDLFRTLWLPAVFFWGLADRTLRALRRSRERADEAQNRLLDTLRGHARQLTQDVESRTRELNQVNRSLGLALDNLKERERARTRFFTAASHDLRQPLHAMRLLFDAARRVDDPVRVKAYLQSVEGASMSLRKLLDALLDLSQLESGTVKTRDEWLRIEDMMAELHEAFSPIAVQKGLSLRIAYPEAPLTLHIDPRLWMSVLNNLVANALKYTHQGGVLVAIRPKDGGLLCQVWDTGQGIAADDLGRVFDEFFQVHNPQRDREQGLGLGLSIVQRTCEVLGLRVSCRSVMGRGSVFEVWLPPRRVIRDDLGTALAPAPAAQPLPASAPFSALTSVSDPLNRWVLVVDDDVFVAEALQASLEAQGLNAVVCHNVGEALAHAWLLRFDAFVVDQQLAGPVSGAELLTRISQLREAPIRAVIVTGNTSPGFMADIPSLGWPVLFKPVGIADVLSALGIVTQGR